MKSDFQNQSDSHPLHGLMAVCLGILRQVCDDLLLGQRLGWLDDALQRTPRWGDEVKGRKQRWGGVSAKTLLKIIGGAQHFIFGSDCVFICDLLSTASRGRIDFTPRYVREVLMDRVRRESADSNIRRGRTKEQREAAAA